MKLLTFLTALLFKFYYIQFGVMEKLIGLKYVSTLSILKRSKTFEIKVFKGSLLIILCMLENHFVSSDVPPQQRAY